MYKLTFTKANARPEIPNLIDGFAMTKNRNRFIFNFSKFFNSFSLQNDSLRSKMSHYPLLWKWVTLFFLLKKRKMSFLAGLGITSEKPPIVIEFGNDQWECTHKTNIRQIKYCICQQAAAWNNQARESNNRSNIFIYLISSHSSMDPW